MSQQPATTEIATLVANADDPADMIARAFHRFANIDSGTGRIAPGMAHDALQLHVAAEAARNGRAGPASPCCDVPLSRDGALPVVGDHLSLAVQGPRDGCSNGPPRRVESRNVSPRGDRGPWQASPEQATLEERASVPSPPNE
jgi:hypothetical protein